MPSVIESMLSRYSCKNINDYRNALKEIAQEIALCGLARGGFFENAAFYGETALRIFYNLNRFSEDMDFSLKTPDSSFHLTKYFPTLRKELEAVGFDLEIESKQKTRPSNIQSAFMKGNTLRHFLKISSIKIPIPGIPSNEQLKIKIEVDTEPPEGASYENKYRLLPYPFSVQLYDEASLFAGKLHAILCRKWQNRIKGRDFYDYVWYLSRNAKVNLNHLQKRLEQTGNWDAQKNLDSTTLKKMLYERFEQVNFEMAKKDVLPFIENPPALDLWSANFFCDITKDWDII